MKSVLARISILVLILLQSVSVMAASNRTKLNFNDAEVLSVIKLMSKATGKTYVFNDNILKGKRITLLSNQYFTPEEASRIFEAILQINGLATVSEGAVTKIITDKEAKGSSVPMYSEGREDLEGSYITRVIPVEHAHIRTVRSNLAPLVSRDATLIAIEESNVLILKDTKENTERFAELVKLIDREDEALDKIHLELFPLQYAKVNEITPLLEKIFSTPAQKGKVVGKQLRIFPDIRTNNLILIGNPPLLEKVKSLVGRLDEEVEREEGNLRVYPLKNANAKTVAETLQKISNTVHSAQKDKKPDTKATIIPDIPSNSLVIFAEKTEFATLENVIAELDTERAQVFIQAIIMEVTLEKSQDLGVKWQASSLQETGGTTGVVTAGGVGATGTPRTLTNAATNTSSAGAVLGVIGGTINYGGTQYTSFNAFIQASQKDNEIDILSNPQILTLNNEEAEIKVGSIIPTIGSTKTDANGNTTTTIDYKEVGVSLKITPQINMDDSIELKIDQTTSNVIAGTSDALSEQGAITTLNRSLKTNVVVEDGQTIVLGGLVSDEVTVQEIKTPCLGDIPVFGWLFKTRSEGIRKTNLLIFLSPKVVRNKEDLEKVSNTSKTRFEGAQQGRFRVDVTKEFNLPVDTRKPIEKVKQKPEFELEEETEQTLPEKQETEEDTMNQSIQSQETEEETVGESIETLESQETEEETVGESIESQTQ